MKAFFLKGDRVVMTEKAIEQGLQGGEKGPAVASSTGVVHRDQEGSLMMILRDNRKHPQSYHVSFWNLDHTRTNTAGESK